MIFQNFNFQFNITIIDFLIIFIVETFFISFIMSKIKIKEYLETLAISNLLKVGLLSLFISWIPFEFNNSFKTVVIFTILLLFSGCIISTIMFQKQLLLSKNESFNAAFQLSVLSSSAFFLIKVLFIPDYYIFYGMATAQFENNSSSSNISGLSSLMNFGNIGVLLLLFGIILFLIFNKTTIKQKEFNS